MRNFGKSSNARRVKLVTWGSGQGVPRRTGVRANGEVGVYPGEGTREREVGVSSVRRVKEGPRRQKRRTSETSNVHKMRPFRVEWRC